MPPEPPPVIPVVVRPVGNACLIRSPRILQQPQRSKYVYVGDCVELSVVASGAEHYAWYHRQSANADHTRINGANLKTLQVE